MPRKDRLCIEYVKEHGEESVRRIFDADTFTRNTEFVGKQESSLVF